MMTPTHMMLAAALFSRPGATSRNVAVLSGGLAPDLGIYALWVWSKLAGVPEWQVWRELYWHPPLKDERQFRPFTRRLHGGSCNPVCAVCAA